MAGAEMDRTTFQKFFEYPLTGIESHALMAPLPHRLNEDPGPTARTAGVLISAFTRTMGLCFSIDQAICASRRSAQRPNQPSRDDKKN